MSDSKIAPQKESGRASPDTLPSDTMAASGGLSFIAVPLPQIQGYEALEEIGRGGMGVVYRTRQLAAGGRVVALKVMLGEAFARPEELRRFEREVEIAAELNHPNIARIYDSGLTHGQHYFAMEFIDGVPLDQYCASRTMRLEDRLQLFTTVCEAIAHAHRRGVIHRDLKPSNILVDAEGKPHILDFGLAKTQSSVEASRSLLTMDGMILGTLPYMAPEQAEGKSTAIDTRTDVYALGVILYELLTGSYPYEVTGQMADVLKRIAEAEPKRPSTVNRLIGDEVETIILRALHKTPDRRYPGADDLARDIAHFLAHEPIEAKRDSGLYVLRKTMRRYRVSLAFAAAIVALIATAAVFSFTLYRRAESQRRAADAAKVEAQQQRNEARKQEAEAEKARKSAEHNLAYAQLAQAGMFLDDGRIMEANSLYVSCKDKLHNLGEPAFPATAGLAKLHALSPPAMLTLRGHTKGIFGVAFSPDGELALSGGYDNDVKLWEVKTGRELRTFRGHQGPVYSVAFSPDGRCILSGSNDKTVKLWEISSGSEVWTFTGHQSGIRAVAFSPNGKWAIAGTLNHAISVCDVSTGCLIRKFGWKEDYAGLFDITVSSDGKHALSAANQDAGITDNALIMWDLDTGLDIRHLKGHGAFTAAFSPDGRHAASGGFDQTIALWDIVTGKELRTFVGHGNPVQQVTFSPDGQRLLSSGWEKTVRLWDVATGQEIRTFAGHEGYVYGSAYSPDGRFALSGSLDGTLKLWEIEPSQEIRPFIGHATQINTLAFSPDGRFALSSSGDSTIRAWDIATGFEIQKITLDKPFSARLSPDGKFAFGASWAHLRLWDIGTGRDRGIPGMFIHSAVSPDGKSAVASYWTKQMELALWDIATGEKIRDLTSDTTTEVGAIAFLPDGKRAITVSSHYTIILWDLITGRPNRTFRGHSDRVVCVAVSRDGAFILSGSWDRTIKLWNVTTGNEVRTLRGHEGHISSVSFSPDGRWAVSSSDDNTARLWDVQSGEEISTLAWKKDNVRITAFSPDGKSVLIGNMDGTIRLWDFSRPEQHQSYTRLMEEAQRRLTKDAHDADALMIVGEYYAFRGVDDWAVEMLERARKGGAKIAPLVVARCHWRLAENGALGQADRLRHRTAAAAEFRKELERVKAQPTPETPEAKLSREQEELYLNLCLQAALGPHSIQDSDSKAGPKQIDLSASYNLSLADDPRSKTNSYQNFTALPSGFQTMAGTMFNVRGVIQLKHKALRSELPSEVRNILINHRCDVLQFLHSTARNSNTTTHAIANYIVHYEDKSSHAIPVLFGQDIAELYRLSGEPPSPPLVVAWSGQNAYTRFRGAKDKKAIQMCLYKMTWRNPHPDKVVKSLDFVSADPDSAPFLIAITAE